MTAPVVAHEICSVCRDTLDLASPSIIEKSEHYVSHVKCDQCSTHVCTDCLYSMLQPNTSQVTTVQNTALIVPVNISCPVCRAAEFIDSKKRSAVYEVRRPCTDRKQWALLPYGLEVLRLVLLIGVRCVSICMAMFDQKISIVASHRVRGDLGEAVFFIDFFYANTIGVQLTHLLYVASILIVYRFDPLAYAWELIHAPTSSLIIRDHPGFTHHTILHELDKLKKHAGRGDEAPRPMLRLEDQPFDVRKAVHSINALFICACMTLSAIALYVVPVSTSVTAHTNVGWICAFYLLGLFVILIILCNYQQYQPLDVKLLTTLVSELAVMIIIRQLVYIFVGSSSIYRFFDAGYFVYKNINTVRAAITHLQHMRYVSFILIKFKLVTVDK